MCKTSSDVDPWGPAGEGGWDHSTGLWAFRGGRARGEALPPGFPAPPRAFKQLPAPTPPWPHPLLPDRLLPTPPQPSPSTQAHDAREYMRGVALGGLVASADTKLRPEPPSFMQCHPKGTSHAHLQRPDCSPQVPGAVVCLWGQQMCITARCCASTQAVSQGRADGGLGTACTGCPVTGSQTRG